MIDVRCINCGSIQTFADSSGGQIKDCKTCGRPVAVPAMATAISRDAVNAALDQQSASLAEQQAVARMQAAARNRVILYAGIATMLLCTVFWLLYFRDR